jgi:hypothetical protein
MEKATRIHWFDFFLPAALEDAHESRGRSEKGDVWKVGKAVMRRELHSYFDISINSEWTDEFWLMTEILILYDKEF